ncbi:ABC transporter substrate-binding protein [Atribacter laminatus]|uniref:Extracellular solute-binding protein n=1 Tax=Atribacter laminatus TaxID=2847778 RepID=A0A7T1F1J8_ATRLM|nr:extracellular solute-binding protein [Atribacter laminatus]QPM66825.1 hypothetical protein RT761_00009 [Atribacter laminatus]
MSYLKSKRGIFLKIAFVTLIISLFSFAAFGEKAWETINWNGPVSMAERISGDKYILPEGWENAIKGVDELVYYNSGGLAGDIATAMNIKLFEELTGLKVKAVPVPSELEHAKSLATLLAQDGSVPLLLVGSPVRELSTFAREEWLTPIDFLYPQDVQDLFTPALKDLHFRNGHWWASQETALGMGVVFYRPSWLEKSGIAVPDNWQDIYTAAKKCRTWAKQELGESYYGMVFSGILENWIDSFQGTLYSQGGSWYLGNEPNMLSEEWKNAFSYWANFILEDIASQEVLNYNFIDRGRVFGIGQAAFGAGIMTSYTMKYMTEFPEVFDDWAIMAPPKWAPGDPEEGRVGWLNGNSGVINKYAPDNHQAAAMLFLDFLRSKEAQTNELIVEGNEAYMLSLYDDPTLPSKVNWNLADSVAEEIGNPHPAHIEEIPYLNIRATLMKYGKTEQLLPGFPQLGTEVKSQFAQVVTGQTTIDDAIQAIQDYAEQLPR